MGRPRKFLDGDIVQWEEGSTRYGVAVGHHGSLYRVVPVSHYIAGKLFGRTRWRAAYKLQPTGYRYARATGVVRANDRMGSDRGCSCNCCAHVAIPRSEIKADGTFKSDER